MKQKALLLLIFPVILSCAGNQPVSEEQQVLPVEEPVQIVQIINEPAPPVEIPAPLPEPVPEPIPEPPPPQPEYVFEWGSITQEEYDSVKFDIQQLVEELNSIIRSRNFNSWLTYLSQEYRARVHSRDLWEDTMQRAPIFRGRINSARDYFNLIIVPSRANDRVDDIDFLSEQRVRAYTVNEHRQGMILYDLEFIGNRWMIIQ